MPYDPTYPPTNAEIESAPLRGQFNGLKTLIDAIQSITAAQVDGVSTLPPGTPAQVNVSVSAGTLHFSFDIPQGQEGVVGPVGPPFSTAVVDGVTTLNPGDPATVDVSFDGTIVHFTFGLPRGNDGSQGPPGNNGSDGGPGAQGPPFAQAVVDGVTTLNPGDPATVGVSFDGTNVRFTFGIPRGNDGSHGGNGSEGAQGLPGEISLAQLNSGLQNTLSQTSANTNGVSTLDTGFADPDLEALRQKLNEMILDGRR
jgi:hypothetical protein